MYQLFNIIFSECNYANGEFCIEYYKKKIFSATKSFVHHFIRILIQEYIKLYSVDLVIFYKTANKQSIMGACRKMFISNKTDFTLQMLSIYNNVMHNANFEESYRIYLTKLGIDDLEMLYVIVTLISRSGCL